MSGTTELQQRQWKATLRDVLGCVARLPHLAGVADAARLAIEDVDRQTDGSDAALRDLCAKVLARFAISGMGGPRLAPGEQLVQDALVGAVRRVLDGVPLRLAAQRRWWAALRDMLSELGRSASGAPSIGFHMADPDNLEPIRDRIQQEMGVFVRSLAARELANGRSIEGQMALGLAEAIVEHVRDVP